MLVIFAVIAAGVVIGRLFSRYKFSFVPRIITIIIWLLLFLLGVEVGANPAVAEGMLSLGWKAFVLFLFSVAGSIAASYLLWRLVRRDIKPADEQ